MLALILQIIFSSAFTLLIKWGQVRDKEDEITFGAINYIVAALCMAPVFWFNPPTEISLPAVWCGTAMGLLYFANYFLVIHAIRSVGAASSTVVSVLSILLPIGLAAFAYGDVPHLIQWLGIGLALAALTLIGVPAKDKADESLVESTEGKSSNVLDEKQTEPNLQPNKPWIVPLVLFLFFLLCGFSRVAQEAFKHFVAEDQQAQQHPIFLISAFASASIPSIFVLIYRRRKIRQMEFGIGFAMGVSNILQTLFILQALKHLKGFIVFPVSSAGNVVLITLIATCLLSERLTRRTLVGIALSVFALFLLKWGM